MSTESKPEEKPTSEEQEVPKEGTEGTTEGSESETEEKGKEESQEGSEGLPEWAQRELKNARAEAANYRTRLREAEAKLSEAKTPEDIEAAISELREQNAKLERAVLVTKVASKHGLDDVLANRLVGSTEEELEADAKLLASRFTSPPAPQSLEGGLTPSGDEDGEVDPRKLAARFRRY